MTKKEFSKLTRHELLELLLMQIREQEQMEERMAEMTEHIHKLEESLEARDGQIHKLEERLEARDGQIHKLEESLDARDGRIHKLEQSLEVGDGQIEEWKEQLYSKDNKIRELEGTLEYERALNKIQTRESGTISEATEKLSGVIEAVQYAADQYIEKITLRMREQDAALQKAREKEQEAERAERNARRGIGTRRRIVSDILWNQGKRRDERG